MSLMSHCPFCGSPIDPSCIDWDCPCCGAKNARSSIMKNCVSCRFAPRIFKCGRCGQFYESLLLMGTFKGPYARIYDPASYPILTRRRYRFRDLKILCTPNLSCQDFRDPGPSFIQDLGETEFSFPHSVKSFMIHTVYSNALNVLWLHGWLFQSEEPILGTHEAVGQMSIRYDRNADLDRIQAEIMDVQMR